MKCVIKSILSRLSVFVFVSAFIPAQVLSQLGQHHEARVLTTSEKRVVFDSGPFSTGSVVPYWDKGYLISLTPQTTSPGPANVRLYDANGHRVRESAIWFPDAQTVFIISAAVTPAGNILASGTAVRGDGTRAYFIARTDASGKVTEVIQTNPFFPANICGAPDETVWSFGDLERNSDGTLAAGNILRQFDFRKGLVASYLPRSTFGSDPRSPAQRGNEGQEVYFRCYASRVVIYTGISDQYVEFDAANGSVKQFRIDRSSANLPVRGFAVTNRGEVYGYLRDYSKPTALQGLFHLDQDPTQATVTWVPVRGASGRKGQAGVISGLWGADGEALVHSLDNDPAGRSGISWSVITRQRTP